MPTVATLNPSPGGCCITGWIEHALRANGYQAVNPSLADVVIVSVGDPFWVQQTYNGSALDELRRTGQKIIIVEKHEYGWSSYTDEHRAQNAWLGAPNYGLKTEIHEKDLPVGNHVSKHQRIIEFVQGIIERQPPPLYLRREYFSDYDYPHFVKPINFLMGSELPMVTKDAFLSRPLDLMCIWGETNPCRKMIADRLKAEVQAGWLRAEIRSPVWIGESGRVAPGEPYRKMHEQARFFVTADGHGLGGGREWELITTSVMLRKKSWMAIHDDYQDGVSMVEFGGPQWDDCRLDEMVEKLKLAMDPDRAYDIYVHGWHHAMAHYSIAGLGRYLENCIGQLGW